MISVSELFEKFISKVEGNDSWSCGYYCGKRDAVNDLVSWFLETNKEIKPIENINNKGKVTIKPNIKEQARVFREFVKACEKVKKNE